MTKRVAGLLGVDRVVFSTALAVAALSGCGGGGKEPLAIDAAVTQIDSGVEIDANVVAVDAAPVVDGAVTIDANVVAVDGAVAIDARPIDGAVAIDARPIDGAVAIDARSIDGSMVPDASVASNIVIISKSASGDIGNGVSQRAAFSSTGRCVGFESNATNLVANDTNTYSDAFVYNRMTSTLALVSKHNGVQGNGASTYSRPYENSSGGCNALFLSEAANFPHGGTPTKSIFQSTSASGSLTSSGSAQGLSVSDLGAPFATEFTPIGQRASVYVVPTFAGPHTLVSRTSGGATPNADSLAAQISRDGTSIVFTSHASDLITGDTNGVTDIFLTGNALGNWYQPVRISVSSGGAQADGGSASPDISNAGGAYIVFSSTATNLVAGDTNGYADIFLRDRFANTTSKISMGTAQSNGDSSTPRISADGRYVVFLSNASNLVSGDTNGVRDIFVYDRTTGAITRQNVSATGEQANALSLDPVISPDGSLIAFSSMATNLVPGAPSGRMQIYLTSRR